MAEAVPKIRVTDPQSKETYGSYDKSSSSGLKADKYSAKLRTGPLSPNSTSSNDLAVQNGVTDVRPEETIVDPLSQVC